MFGITNHRKTNAQGPEQNRRFLQNTKEIQHKRNDELLRIPGITGTLVIPGVHFKLSFFVNRPLHFVDLRLPAQNKHLFARVSLPQLKEYASTDGIFFCYEHFIFKLHSCVTPLYSIFLWQL